MFRTRLCVYVFVGGLLPSTLYVPCWHYVPLLQREECSQVLLAWEVCILSAFSRGCKSRDNSWAQVDIVDSRIELAEVDEIKQEANKVPLLDKPIRIKVLWWGHPTMSLCNTITRNLFSPPM